VLLTFELDLGTRVLAEEDAVADLQLEGADLAVLQDLAIANREDLSLERFLLGGVGDDDASLGLFFFFHALHDDAVRQGPELHGKISCVSVGVTGLLALSFEECQAAGAR
jgi:hypothetical protein